MPTAVILPVKRFEHAKQRLGASLPPARRRDLAMAMVGDVLDALAAVRGVDLTIVVSAEPAAVRAARQAGAVVVHDASESGQSAAAAAGIAEAVRRGARRALLVPGDCPALDADEVSALLAAGDAGVTIVPDRHGTGTNALLLGPADVIAPAFGPGSFTRHVRAAEAAGVTPAVAALPSLVLDVDTPDDLAALRAALDGRPGGAERTRAALAGALASDRAA